MISSVPRLNVLVEFVMKASIRLSSTPDWASLIRSVTAGAVLKCGGRGAWGKSNLIGASEASLTGSATSAGCSAATSAGSSNTGAGSLSGGGAAATGSGELGTGSK